MKTTRKKQGWFRVFFGFTVLIVAAAVAVKHLRPGTEILFYFLGGYFIYLWGCGAMAKSKGYTGAQGVLAGIIFPVILVLLMPDRNTMPKAQRDADDHEEAVEQAAKKAARRRPLARPKKALAWLLGLFLFLLGASILAGFEAYNAKVLKPELNQLGTAVSISADTLDPQNDGKLVHVTGELAGIEKLSDAEFGVTVGALKLRRRVWMYQWQQGSLQGKTSFGMQDDKGTTTLLKTKTYNYSKNWFENVINSQSFYNAGHDNPSEMKVPARTVAASNMKVGVFGIAPELSAQLDNYSNLPITLTNLATLDHALRTQAKQTGGEIFFGASQDEPAVGDLKVRLEAAMPTNVSIIARQQGTILSAYKTGRSSTLALLRVGNYTAPEMAAQFAKTNFQQRMLVWVAGGLFISCGLGLFALARGK